MPPIDDTTKTASTTTQATTPTTTATITPTSTQGATTSPTTQSTTQTPESTPSPTSTAAVTPNAPTTAASSTTTTTTEEPLFGNVCDSDPCLNGGTCAEGSLAGFRCNCAFGFDGVHCETDLTPNFNFSTILGLAPSDLGVTRNAYNPFYVLADYFNPLQTKDGNVHAAMEDVPCREDTMDCVKLQGATSRLNPMATLMGTCLQEMENCADGLALSMWLYLDSTAKDVTPSVVLSVEDGSLNVPNVKLSITSQRDLQLSVNDGTTLSDTTIPSSSVHWGRWFNFGMTWAPGLDPLVYVNSRLTGESSQSDVTTAMEPSTGREVWLGTKEGTNSASPVIVSDFVYWERFLFEFESYRFLGMTDKEVHTLYSADYWWTVDGFARRDHTLLADYSSDVASTTPISTDNIAAASLTTGRDGKGNALDIDGEEGSWLMLGEHPDTCISDPSLCHDGITVGMWVRLYEPLDDGFHCLASSGGQTTRGFTLYQSGKKLRAMVANGERQWITEIPFDKSDGKEFGQIEEVAIHMYP